MTISNETNLNFIFFVVGDGGRTAELLLFSFHSKREANVHNVCNERCAHMIRIIHLIEFSTFLSLVRFLLFYCAIKFSYHRKLLWSNHSSYYACVFGFISTIKYRFGLRFFRLLLPQCKRRNHKRYSNIFFAWFSVFLTVGLVLHMVFAPTGTGHINIGIYHVLWYVCVVKSIGYNPNIESSPRPLALQCQR